jgi:hypothetical protein
LGDLVDREVGVFGDVHGAEDVFAAALVPVERGVQVRTPTV